MDYEAPAHLKTYKPNPNFLYYHPGYKPSEDEKWTCCNQRVSYIAQRGCGKIPSFWMTRKYPLFYYLHKKEDKKTPLGRLPEQLVKDIIFYL